MKSTNLIILSALVLSVLSVQSENMIEPKIFSIQLNYTDKDVYYSSTGQILLQPELMCFLPLQSISFEHNFTLQFSTLVAKNDSTVMNCCVIRMI